MAETEQADATFGLQSLKTTYRGLGSNIEKVSMKKRGAAIFLGAITMLLCEGMALAQQVGDTFDQFFRYVEVKNKVPAPWVVSPVFLVHAPNRKT